MDQGQGWAGLGRKAQRHSSHIINIQVAISVHLFDSLIVSLGYFCNGKQHFALVAFKEREREKSIGCLSNYPIHCWGICKIKE